MTAGGEPAAAGSEQARYFGQLKQSLEGVMTGQIPPPPKLTASDRCDRCGAQAYVRTEPVQGMELLWCRHHFAENEAKLAASVTSDQTSDLF